MATNFLELSPNTEIVLPGDLPIPLVEKTWSELKSMRDGGTLIPGQCYRITDYQATVANDENARAVNHPFDIIVVADSVNKLNEKAHAIQHSGDTYFNECKLEAWQIWYCIDNDTSRFAWADAENGKGVIYRMIDEWNNDVPYDFKGIQFLPYNDVITVYAFSDLPNTGDGSKIYYISSTGETYKWNQNWDENDNGNIDDGEEKYVLTADTAWRYTFDSGDKTGSIDYSLNGGEHYIQVYENIITPYRTDGKINLNRITFKGYRCYGNYFGTDCHSNSFGNGYCYCNSFGDCCFNNSFGGYCNNNSFGHSCCDNSFGNGCFLNFFRSACCNNSFEMDCSSNSFGDNCIDNSFGRACRDNFFENNCNGNSFGVACNGNFFKNDCDGNFFDDYCCNNSFEHDCINNSFGHSCCDNSFGISCTWIKFGTSNSTKNYCRYITVESGNRYIYLNPTGTTSYSSYYQNVMIVVGVNNTKTWKTITDSNVGQTFKTTYQPANSQIISI